LIRDKISLGEDQASDDEEDYIGNQGEEVLGLNLPEDGEIGFLAVSSLFGFILCGFRLSSLLRWKLFLILLVVLILIMSCTIATRSPSEKIRLLTTKRTTSETRAKRFLA
jgi:hypothetical protein